MTPAEALAEKLELLAAALRGGTVKPWAVGWLCENMRPILRVVAEIDAYREEGNGHGNANSNGR